MNGVVLFMTLFFGIAIGALLSTPIMQVTASVFLYANAERLEGSAEENW